MHTFNIAVHGSICAFILSFFLSSVLLVTFVFPVPNIKNLQNGNKPIPPITITHDVSTVKRDEDAPANHFTSDLKPPVNLGEGGSLGDSRTSLAFVDTGGGAVDAEEVPSAEAASPQPLQNELDTPVDSLKHPTLETEGEEKSEGPVDGTIEGDKLPLNQDQDALNKDADSKTDDKKLPGVGEQTPPLTPQD